MWEQVGALVFTANLNPFRVRACSYLRLSAFIRGCTPLSESVDSKQINGKKMKTYANTLTTFTVGISCSLDDADVTGKWKSAFDTQIGNLKYIYEFKADGEKLTGKALREREG